METNLNWIYFSIVASALIKYNGCVDGILSPPEPENWTWFVYFHVKKKCVIPLYVLCTKLKAIIKFSWSIQWQWSAYEGKNERNLIMTTMKRATTYKARFPGTHAVQCFQRFTEYFINYHFVGSTMPFFQASLHHSSNYNLKWSAVQ